MQQSDFIAGSEICRALKVQKKTVYRLIKLGELVPHKRGKELKRMMFPLANVIEVKKSLDARKEQTSVDMKTEAPVEAPAETKAQEPVVAKEEQKKPIEYVSIRDASELIGITYSALQGILFRGKDNPDYSKQFHNKQKGEGREVLLDKEEVIAFKAKWYPDTNSGKKEEPKNRLLTWEEVVACTGLTRAQVEEARKMKDLKSLHEDDVLSFMEGIEETRKRHSPATPKAQPTAPKRTADGKVVVQSTLDIPQEAVKQLLAVFKGGTSLVTEHIPKLEVLEVLWERDPNPFAKILGLIRNNSYVVLVKL